jgi:Flp pilus assembly protein TadD
MRSATKAVEKALELDPSLAEAYACRGCVRSVFEWAWGDAEADFLRAAELNPSYPTAHHWYGINHLVPRGRFDEAEAALRRALELDPLALAIRTSLGMAAYFAGRFDQAEQELLRTLQLDERFAMARIFLGATYIEQGRYADALTEIEAAIRLCGRTPDILANLGYLYGRSGDLSGARGVLDELRRLSADRYVSPVRLAQVQVALGERAEALDALEAAAGERAADLAWVAVRAVFADLHGEPRFAALLERMGLQGVPTV